MQIKHFTTGMLLVIFFLLPPAQAAVSVSAQVDRTVVSPGQSLQMQVKVNGGTGEVDLSPIEDFKVRFLGSGSSVQNINGRLSKEIIYNYLLIPRGEGTLRIPALTVTVDGQTHRTSPISVTVSEAPATGGKGHVGRDVWITAELSDNTPYVGQQVTYTLRFRRAVPINEAKFQAPAFKGFSADDVEEQHTYRKVINGREHVVTEVYVILTPLEAGEMVIGPAVVNVGVIRQRQGRSRSPFDEFFNRRIVEPLVLQTEALNLSVQPLPPVPPSLEFSGLVGRFELTAETEATRLTAGDSATVAITVQGKGNIADAQQPELALPAAFKSYADQPEDEVVVDRNGTSGKRVFRTALVPVEPGRYTVGPIRVTYFDVDRKAYQTLVAQLPSMTVAPKADSDSAPLTVAPGISPLQKKKVAFTGRDILPPKESLSAIQPAAPLGWMFFLLLLAAPACVYGLVMLTQHILRPDTSAAAAMRARARQALKKARSGEDEALWTSLHRALTAAIFAAADRKGEALTWKEAEALLLAHQFSEEDAEGAAKLLAEIESIKFGGMTLPEGRRDMLLDQTRTMVRKLAP